MSQYLEILEEIAGRAKLVVVSKRQSVEAIQALYDEGCRDFGENRLPEALEKIEQLPSDINWHFIGTLQRKKVPKVGHRFALIHSVDTQALAEKVGTDFLLQVNTSGEATKHGFTPEELMGMEVPRQAKGLMTMAPLTDDEAAVRRCFCALRELRDRLDLQELSMGMSHDWRIALEEGATILRIGSAIFS